MLIEVAMLNAKLECPEGNDEVDPAEVFFTIKGYVIKGLVRLKADYIPRVTNSFNTILSNIYAAFSFMS